MRKVTAFRMPWNQHAECLSHSRFNSSCSVVPQEMKERKTKQGKTIIRKSQQRDDQTDGTPSFQSSDSLFFFCLVWTECLVILLQTVVSVWMMVVCLIVSHFELKFHTKDLSMTICCYETPRRRHQLVNNMVGLLLQKTPDATTCRC